MSGKIESDEKKEKKLRHIVLKPIESVRFRGVGRAISSPLYRPIGKDSFKNMINKIIETYSVKLKSRERSYFVIDLTIPYHSADVSKMIKKLKLDLKSVIDRMTILVSGDKKYLLEYIDKEKIYKYITNPIKSIRVLESSDKIGKSLQKAMKDDVDKKKSFTIMSRLFENIDKDEEELCKSQIYGILSNERTSSYNPYSSTISCRCSGKKIEAVAQIPFIKLITESPITKRRTKKMSESILEHTLFKKEQVSLENSPNLAKKTPICIIDSGVSDILDPFVITKDSFNFLTTKETVWHGTMVSSVAIFGEDLLEKKNILKAKTKIISVKLDDESIPDDRVMIEEAIIYAITKYKHITPIFNISYCHDTVADEQRIEMVKRLDRFIQENNVIVVNSAGNIPSDEAYYLKDRYPTYIMEHPVFFPSEARNILSVGSICSKSTERNIIYSSFTRAGVPPLFINQEIDKYEYLKPEIYTKGGNAVPDNLKYTNETNEEVGFPVIYPIGDVALDYGTSFAAPLISLCLARLYEAYGNSFENCETFKAILLNKCIIGDINGLTTLSLIDTRNVAYCNDGIYINFEGISHPHEKSENKDNTKIIRCKNIKFYMPIEAESVDVTVVHSNNYPEQNSRDFLTKVILKLQKPTGPNCKKDYGTMGRKTAVAYGHYRFKRGYEGQWSVDLHIETSGIPSEFFDKINIRFGVSIRINIKPEYKNRMKEIYYEVSSKTIKKETTSSEIIISNENSYFFGKREETTVPA